VKQATPIFVFFCFIYSFTYSQKYNVYKVSAGLGASAYFGELVGMPQPKDVSPAFSIEGSYNLTTQLRGRITISGLGIRGNDRNSDKSSHKERNLDFSSFVWDVNLAAEYDFLNENDFKIIPYAFVGPGVFGFNPITHDGTTGERVQLQKYGTEGQGLSAYPDRKPYDLTQINIGGGGGLKVSINKSTQVSAEIFFRYTFTDYLDDISIIGYVNPVYFQNEGKLKSLEYSYRGSEYPNFTPFSQKIYNRGNTIPVDFFYSTQLKITFNIGGESSDYYYQNKSSSSKFKCVRLVL